MGNRAFPKDTKIGIRTLANHSKRQGHVTKCADFDHKSSDYSKETGANLSNRGKEQRRKHARGAYADQAEESQREGGEGRGRSRSQTRSAVGQETLVGLGGGVCWGWCGCGWGAGQHRIPVVKLR